MVVDKISKIHLFFLTILCSFVFVLIFVVTKVFEPIEVTALDLLFQKGVIEERADTSIVVAAIDDKSLKFFEEQGAKWPWPREYYALAVDYLSEAGAKLIIPDIDFSGKSIDRLEVEGSESDSIFAASIQQSTKVLLASIVSQDDSGKVGAFNLDSRLVSSSICERNEFDGLKLPENIFLTASKKVGIASVFPEEDGVIRNTRLMIGIQGKYYPNFGLAAYCLLNNRNMDSAVSDLRQKNINAESKLLVNWYGKGGPEGVFKYYSIHAIILSAFKVKNGLPPDISPEIFKNKVVFIGATAPALSDYKPVPVSKLSIVPGVEIHATVLSNLLNSDFVNQVGIGLRLLLIALLITIIGALFFNLKNLFYSISISALLIFAITYFIYFLFHECRIYIHVFEVHFSIFVTMLFSAVASYFHEGRQKNMLKKTFIKYLNPAVVEDIIARPNSVELGGKDIYASAFFTDIKDFTTLSEQFAPKELVYHLNNYLTLASDIVLKNDAFLDKYIGDAIMAIFGAPIERDDHAYLACKSALEIQKMLHEFYKTADSSIPVFETRIGINSGKMVIGNIGSQSRLDYTAIGDTVNLASRLEGINKFFGTHIITSETTHNLVSDKFVFRQLDFIKAKGATKPMKIFELISNIDEIDNDINDKVAKFEQAFLLYRNKKFNEAISLFTLISEKYNDYASALYVDRCRKLLTQDLDDSWDGVYSFKEK